MTRVMTLDIVTDRSLAPLARSPLRLALTQARVTPTPALESLEVIGRIAEALPGWALRSRHTSREAQVIVSNEGIHESVGAAETVSVLQAAGDEGLRAAVSPSSVAVEYDRYTAWPRLHAAITAVFSACAQHISGTCERFGVRYVNEIEDERASGEPGQLAQLLTAALVAPITALDRRVIGSQQELRVAEDNGEFVLRHGLRRAGVYLLDLDHFTAEPQPFVPEALAALADGYHRRIENVFVWALHPDYLAELQGEVRDA